MYLKYYYEQKGYFILDDKNVYNFQSLNKSKSLILKINIRNKVEIKQINFVLFLILKLWYPNSQLKKGYMLSIIHDYNEIFSFFENLVLVWLPLSSNVKISLLNKNWETTVTYNIKNLPLLEELEILFEHNDYYYYLLQTNMISLNLNTKYDDLLKKENFIRFIKIPLQLD